MEYIRNHDSYLDPPDVEYKAACRFCETRMECSDMVLVGEEYVCRDCEDNYPEEYQKLKERHGE